MQSMKEACKVRVGYSDHVQNNYACFAAAAMGAEIIEKHFTLDTAMEGPDHSSSLDPAKFKELVEGIRNVEKALGTGLKKPTPVEIDNSYGMKRSLVLNCDLPAGTILEKTHIGFKRPFNGLSPNMFDQVIGKKITRDMLKDEAIQYNSIEW
jgi:sialic acid synthase SpsE